jgi:hypothetical protein
MASCGMAAHRSDYMADADAALLAIEASGAVVVPKQPTDQMLIDAGPMDGYDTDSIHSDRDHIEWWKAMLSASPFAKEPGNG